MKRIIYALPPLSILSAAASFVFSHYLMEAASILCWVVTFLSLGVFCYHLDRYERGA